MSCIVVGNSPDVYNKGDIIDCHEIIIRTGVPCLSGNEQHLGYKTDMLVTRRKKYNRTCQKYIDTFNTTVKLNDNKNISYMNDTIYILSNNSLEVRPDMMNHVDNLGGLNDQEKPTLGFIAVCLAMTLSDRVNLCGVETDYNSKYISRGHYSDPQYVRVNDIHCLYKEMLFYNKHMRSGILNLI
jgi:hypothetical protein